MRRRHELGSRLRKRGRRVLERVWPLFYMGWGGLVSFGGSADREVGRRDGSEKWETLPRNISCQDTLIKMNQLIISTYQNRDMIGDYYDGVEFYLDLGGLSMLRPGDGCGRSDGGGSDGDWGGDLLDDVTAKVSMGSVRGTTMRFDEDVAEGTRYWASFGMGPSSGRWPKNG